MSETATESDVLTAKVPGASDGSLVHITLAHRLEKDDLRALHLDPEAKTKPGTRVAVRREQAQSLIAAGYASGVDSEDRKAVAAALRNNGQTEGLDDVDRTDPANQAQATGQTIDPVEPEAREPDNAPGAAAGSGDGASASDGSPAAASAGRAARGSRS